MYKKLSRDSMRRPLLRHSRSFKVTGKLGSVCHRFMFCLGFLGVYCVGSCEFGCQLVGVKHT